MHSFRPPLRAARLALAGCACAVMAVSALAGEPARKAVAAKNAAAAKAPAPLPPTPTRADVPYGAHERQVLDFWQAPAAQPTPLLFFIHGGGWMNGDKSRVAGLVKVEDLLAEYSPYALVSAGDARVYLFYSAPPALGQEQKDPTHTSNFGVKLQERCREFGVPCELVYPGAPEVKHPTIQEYLIATLKGPAC